MEIDTIIGFLIGLRDDGPETAKKYAEIAGQRAAEHTFGVSEGELQKMAEELPANCSVILIILEHIWIRNIRIILAGQGGVQ
jgi:hypothetical protein